MNQGMANSNVCVHCGQKNLAEFSSFRPKDPNLCPGLRHGVYGKDVLAVWLCENCENRLSKLKGMCNEAFGLTPRKEHLYMGELVYGWWDE